MPTASRYWLCARKRAEDAFPPKMLSIEMVVGIFICND